MRRAAATALLILLSSAASPADSDRVVSMAAAAGQPAPTVRIGLEPAHAVKVSASGSFRIVDAANGKPVWRDRFRGAMTVVAEGGPPEGAPSIYRVQVSAFSDAEAAETERRRLAGTFGVEGVVRHNPDRGQWRVRLGGASRRGGLDALTRRLREAGFDDVWIVEEPSLPAASVTLRLVDASFDSLATGRTRLVLVPVGGSTVEVEGHRYRGVVELRVSPFGTVRPINWVGLELYLRGVVPAELGPEVWPQLEALKAQSVAARTYVWRHRGQFEDEGFDICATPRCQVYKGRSAEHPLSDRAVTETKGQVLWHDGGPINAFYTATCGGHTEDGDEIFPGEGASYLTGVPCRAEGDALEDQVVELRGRRPLQLIAEDGSDVSRDFALLEAAGIVDAEPATLDSPLTADLLRRFDSRMAAACGRPAPASQLEPIGHLADALRMIIDDLGWAERVDLLLADADVPVLLRDPSAEALEPTLRRALAYMVQLDAVRPGPDGTFGVEGRPSAARVLPALTAIGDSCGAFDLEDAVVAGKSRAGVRMSRGRTEWRLGFSKRPFLLHSAGGSVVGRSEMKLWPGDRVRYILDGDGTIGYLEVVPPVRGASDDRSSSRYSWEVRRSRHQLEQTLNRRLSIGTLQDLQVSRRGRSGRITALRVVGSGGVSEIRGFDVRRLLGLLETFTVIEIQRDPAGRVDSVVFAGKGWGHGVGLCQVGAYGMALRGEDYVSILGHYYRGAKLAPITKP